MLNTTLFTAFTRFLAHRTGKLSRRLAGGAVASTPPGLLPDAPASRRRRALHRPLRRSTRLGPIYLFGALAGLFVALLLAAPARAQTNDKTAAQQIRAMMEQRDRDLKLAVKPLIDNPKAATAQQRKKVENLINDPIDFQEMGRQALGPFWKDLTQAQRTAFVDVFATIVRAQSLADLEVYNAAVRYETINVVGDSAYVKTSTTYQDKQTTVEYILGRHDNTWWVHDIVLDEVSTVKGYARSFQSVLRKKGYDALMDSLYKKRDKVQAKT